MEAEPLFKRALAIDRKVLGHAPVQINFPVPHPPVGVGQMGQGGGSYQGRDCSPLTAHGFHGIEAEVVQGIVAWIKGVSAKRSRPPK